MKNIITAIILLFSLSITAQEKPYEKELPVNDSGLIDFTEVVKVDGASSFELYSRAREWFVTTFNSAEAVLQMDDKESGKLIGKAFSDIVTPAGFTPITDKLHYTLSIYLKDGRYKYSITSLQIQQYPSTSSPSPEKNPIEYLVITNRFKKNGKIRPYSAAVRSAMIRSVEGLILEIKSAMESKPGDSDDDW